MAQLIQYIQDSVRSLFIVSSNGYWNFYVPFVCKSSTLFSNLCGQRSYDSSQSIAKKDKILMTNWTLKDLHGNVLPPLFSQPFFLAIQSAYSLWAVLSWLVSIFSSTHILHEVCVGPGMRVCCLSTYSHPNIHSKRFPPDGNTFCDVVYENRIF